MFCSCNTAYYLNISLFLQTMIPTPVSMTKLTIFPTEKWLSGFSKLSLLSKLSNQFSLRPFGYKSNYCQIFLLIYLIPVTKGFVCFNISSNFKYTSLSLSLYVHLNLFHPQKRMLHRYTSSHIWITFDTSYRLGCLEQLCVQLGLV